MASDGPTTAAASVTYHTVMQSLASLSERAKKHRKSGGGRALDGVLADAEQLLFSLKHHSMHSDSPSSRVVEAQALMNKAAIEKIAGHPEDEAAAYLTASGLWMAIEAERKAVNMMTTGDALARAVLCCAMACNVLLTVKPNVASSPLPIKLTKMLHQHLARCWSVCMRLAHRLGEFGCFEMSADYFELAAILTTMDGGAAATAGPPPTPPRGAGSNNGKRGGGASNESQQPPSVSQHCDVESVMSGPFGTPTTAAQSRGGPRSNSLRGGGTGSVASGYSPTRRLLTTKQPALAGSPTHSVRSRGAATSFSTTYRADRVFSGSVYGAELKRGQAPPALILNGFLHQYITALASCAMTTALIQDYPRCLTLLDDLLTHMVGIERSRRPELRPAWAQRRVHASGDGDGDRLSDPDEPPALDDAPPSLPACQGVVLSTEVPFEEPTIANDADPPTASDGHKYDAQGNRPTTSAEDTVAAALHVHAAETASVVGSSSVASEPPSVPAQLPLSGTTPSSSQNLLLNNSSMVSGGGGHRSATTASRAPTVMPSSSSSLPPLGGCPLAPPPGGSLHAHAVFTNMEHFFFLVETESTYIQMRIVKILVLLILRDPKVSQSGARDEIGALYELGQLYRTHERFSQFRSKSHQHTATASVTTATSMAGREAVNGGGETVVTGAAATSFDAAVPLTPSSSSSFSSVLFQICATLEVIVDGSEATSLRRHVMPTSGGGG